MVKKSLGILAHSPLRHSDDSSSAQIARSPMSQHFYLLVFSDYLSAAIFISPSDSTHDTDQRTEYESSRRTQS